MHRAEVLLQPLDALRALDDPEEKPEDDEHRDRDENTHLKPPFETKT